MKVVLIPVDFSDGSMNSCHYALHFLVGQSATLHLYHIYNDQIMIPDSSFPGGMDTDAFFNSDVILAMKEQAEETMKEFVSELKKYIKEQQLEVKVAYSLEGGDPQWEITEATEELEPDLVVMGTRGQGKKGFLEGSMAEKIMNKAPVPVLAVPEDYSDYRLKNIMYPTNFNKLDIYTLKRILSLTENKKFTLHVCHFSPDKEDQEINILMEELEQAFDHELKKGTMKFSIVKSGNKIEALRTFAEYNSIDMIAFLSEKKHIIKDLFTTHDFHKKDFFNLELPMLAMHENK
ncbi:MAG: universal stress protein [Bacteroidales bacterium]|nr:universal stress protein [Bacteroidales bacterium]